MPFDRRFISAFILFGRVEEIIAVIPANPLMFLWLILNPESNIFLNIFGPCVLSRDIFFYHGMNYEGSF